MDSLRGSFATYPELAVYLALGLGFWLGNRQFRSFSLGGTTGSLLAGLFLGLLFPIPPLAAAKSLVFPLFLFAIGYEVGPPFLSAMKARGWRFAALGAFMPLVGLLAATLVATALKLSPGFAAGLLSGSLTQSPAIGTALDAIQSLDIDPALKQTYAAQVGVADALCYLGGALGVLLFCSTIGPRLLRLDLPAEARQLEATYGLYPADRPPAADPCEHRTYRLAPGAPAAQQTAAEIEQSAPICIERLRRGSALLEVQPHTRLRENDVLLVSGPRPALLHPLGPLAHEVTDRALLAAPPAPFQLILTAPAGCPWPDLPATRGLCLRRLIRRGHEIPLGTRTALERGDLLHLIGSPDAQRRAAHSLGKRIAPPETADFAALGGAIFLGGLLSAASSFSLGPISTSLGTSLGVLLAGIAAGALHSRHPLSARIPDQALKCLQSYGLAAFVAMVGLEAGPHFGQGLREVGPSLLLGGLLVTLAPLFAGLYFGRYVLNIPPLLLLGAIAGAQTFTPGLAAVQERSRSSIAVLGYSGAAPLAHILLTLWGSLIVRLLA